MSKSIAVAYFSGYGHTAKVAEAIAKGISEAGAQASLIKVDAITDADWDTLDKADGIIFGAPTYMGGPAGQFKIFADATAKVWGKQLWKDKIAGGFTNSASYSGDKLLTLHYFQVLAMQHAMIWVGVGDPAPMFSGDDMPTHDKVNRIGSFGGVMTQSNHKDGPDIAPPAGDLETAQHYGKRVAEIAGRLS